jgi:hypothetical protein
VYALDDATTQLSCKVQRQTRLLTRAIGGVRQRSNWHAACRKPVGSVVRKMVGRDPVQVDSVRETVTSRKEVRPMNAVTMWVLPLVFTAER